MISAVANIIFNQNLILPKIVIVVMLNRGIIVVLFFLFFHVTNLMCQEYQYVPFPDSSAIWSEVYYPPLDMDGNFPPPIYERFALSGEDTIINELLYKKLFIFYDTVFSKDNGTCIGGIREDEHRRIYYKGDSDIHSFKPSFAKLNNMGDELLLYDYSLSIGDTFQTGNLSMFDEYIVVSSVDMVLVGGVYRKEYHFDQIYWVTWIEGIGNTKGLLFTSGDLPTNGLDNDLICFKYKGNILYLNEKYDECFPPITGIKDHCRQEAINLYPNPAGDEFISFDFSSTKIEKLMVYDSHGIILVHHSALQSKFFLSVEKYQPGIYFYRATSISGIDYTGKFVVQ